MKKYILLLGILVLAFSCKDEEPEPEMKGSIFVTVTHNWDVVADAQITTEPATSMVTTDITGTAIITEVPIGGYKVVATHPNIGTGSASVTVTENEVMDVTVGLISGVFENPTVSILSPANGSKHNLGDNIDFAALVGDEADDANTLELTWSSSLDGTLNTDIALATGQATFTTNALSEGEHVISLVAKDSDDLETHDEITITVSKLPESVTLNPIVVSSSGLELDWSTSSEPDFGSYRVTRSENSGGPFEVVDVVSDINTTAYTDTEVVFGVRYYYQVRVVLNNGDESFSNVESQLYEGDHIDVGVNLVRMIVDPSRPYIYALDQINNSLLFINKETKSVEKTIFIGSSPTDIDINLDYSRAYVANFGSTQIAVVDLDSQEKIDDLFVNTEAGTWDGNPYSVVWLKGNYLAYTSEDQWNNIKVVDAETGSLVSFGGSIHSPFLDTSPERDIIYAVDGGDVIRFNVSASGELNEVDETSASNGWGREMVVSRNGTYIFRGRNKFLANNLSSVLGGFGENIYACNEDGSVAIGETKVWNGTDFSIISILPVESTLMLMDTDDETVMIYDNNTSKIYLVKI